MQAIPKLRLIGGIRFNSWYNPLVKKLVLASQSPRRKQILKKMGFDFVVKVSPYDEDTESMKYKDLGPKKFAEFLALNKAQHSIKDNPDSIILAADTTVDLKGKIIGKPKDLEHAREMLKDLSGNKHAVYTSYVIMDTKSGKKLQKTIKSELKFRKISNSEIEDYLKRAKVSDKAGAYAIQEEAGEFVQYTKGDYLNIVGLPSGVRQDLIAFGVKPK